MKELGLGGSHVDGIRVWFWGGSAGPGGGGGKREVGDEIGQLRPIKKW